MFPIKQFSFDGAEQFCTNFDTDIMPWVHLKIEHYLKFSNYSSRQEQLALVKDILDMSKFDGIEATFDYTGIQSVRGHERTENDKERWINFYNVVLYGMILLNVFDAKENRIIEAVDGQLGPIDTSHMLKTGYSNLIESKKDNGSAVPACLIFSTMIEGELKRRIKNRYMIDRLSTFAGGMASNSYVFTQAENELYLHLRNDALGEANATPIFDDIYATTTGLFELVTKYDSQNMDRKLIMNEHTLGSLLNDKSCTDYIDNTCLLFFKMLYLSKAVFKVFCKRDLRRMRVVISAGGGDLSQRTVAQPPPKAAGS